MIPDFINLTDRRTKVSVFVNVAKITSIVDNRTSASCTEISITLQFDVGQMYTK